MFLFCTKVLVATVKPIRSCSLYQLGNMYLQLKAMRFLGSHSQKIVLRCVKWIHMQKGRFNGLGWTGLEINIARFSLARLKERISRLNQAGSMRGWK